MNNLKKLACSAAAAGLLSAFPAMAQDGSWDRASHFDGPYVQGAIGIGLDGNNGRTVDFDTNRDGTFGQTVTTTTGANAFSPGFCPGASNGNSFAAGCSNDKEGLDYAIRLGLDKRMGNIVIGGLVEGSRSESRDSTSAFSTTPAAYRLDRSLDYAVSARAKLGYTPGGGALFYGTGGVSYARLDHDFSTTNTANAFAENNGDDMVWGWQAGGGAEIMLTNSLSLGMEYLYSKYDDDKYSVAVTQGTAPVTNPFLLNGGGTNLRPADTHYDFHSVRATVGLRF